MWGEAWGELIWGRPEAVPGMGFWAAVLLVALFAVLGLRRLLRTRYPLTAVTLAVLTAALAVPLAAGAVMLPFSFTNGTVADADEVNANFQALSDSVNAGPQMYLNANFQSLPLSSLGPVTVASLSLPAGQYLLQAKMRYQNTSDTAQLAGCVFENAEGSSIGSLDSSEQSIPAFAGGQYPKVDGYMMTSVQFEEARDLRVVCFGTAAVEIINSHFLATRSAIAFQ